MLPRPFRGNDEAGSDGDADGDAFGDAEGDAFGDGDPEADEPAPPEEICGNCVDEDGDGEAPACDGDQLTVTPLEPLVGEVALVAACTEGAWVCPDLACRQGTVATPDSATGPTRGPGCWRYEITFPTSGTWQCTHSRQLDEDRDPDTGRARCIADDVVEQVCLEVVVGP